MIHPFSQILYWLVDYPAINQFEWKKGQTFGSTPLFVVCTVVTYLSFTFILRDARLPAPRVPYLRGISAVYNVTLILLSLLMAVGGLLSVFSQMPHSRWIFCFPREGIPQRGPLFFWAQVYYLSKILEFTDTALIILGNRQLTFLHVYHHAMVVPMSYQWLYSSQSLLAVPMVLNSSVHVIMYGYYLMCALGMHPSWKRLVTNCQLLQFTLAVPFSAVMLYFHFTGDGCSGIWGWLLNVAFEASLFALFLDFHTKNYPRKLISSNCKQF